MYMEILKQKKNVELVSQLQGTRKFSKISMDPFCKSRFCVIVKCTWKFPRIILVKKFYRAREINIDCTLTLGTRKYPWILSVAK